MKKSSLIITAVLAMAAAGGAAYKFDVAGLASNSGNASKDKKGDKKATPPLVFRSNEIIKPTQIALGSRIEWSGPLTAPQTAIVRSKTAGTLLSLTVKEGDSVKLGQSLGAIDLSDVNNRVTERGATLESARASLALAQSQYDSNLRLSENGFISPVAMATFKSQLDAAKAQVKASETQLGSARIAMREAALLAPITGVVVKRNALPGEKVSPEQALITLMDIRSLEMSGSVAPHLAASIRPGALVSLQVDGMAKAIQATIERVGPLAEAGSKALPVVVRIANSDGQLQPGQYASASIEVADSTQRLTVPVQAVQDERGQNIVWIIESNTIKRRAVTVGRRDAQGIRVEITDGLKGGESILAMRFDQLRDGAAARVDGGAETGAEAKSVNPVQPSAAK